MALTNRDRIDRAFGILGTALGPFVERTLAPLLPAGVQWTVLLAGKDGRADRDYSSSDVHYQLRAITEKLGSFGYAFNDALSRGEQNLASELRQVRNTLAHEFNHQFSADDTYRVLDTAERLLRAIGAPAQADEIRGMRLDAQRATYEKATRNAVRTAATAMPELGETDLTPWRDVLTPHPDVAEGNVARAEFAADLYRVARGEGPAEYVDPIRFFERTFLTEGLKTLLTMSARRIAGDENAQAVINLQTTFGGGKTHSMLAAWHLFSGRPLLDYPQDLQDLLGDAPARAFRRQVRRVAIVGNELAPGQSATKPDGTIVRTIWGELAWQLGGAEGYALVAEADRTGTNPGEALRELVGRYSPALILIDEWVAYARQLHSRDDLPGGTFDTQFTFAQQLTQAVQSVPGALLLVSIPASDVRFADEGETRASDLEIGGANGRAALQRLQHVVGRVAHNWTPASSGESFEIVRRRLFAEPDAEARRKIDATVRRFIEYYRSQMGELPPESRQPEYESRLRAAYPVHPELFDRLYGDWSTLERFQRTRGVLRMMSAIVHALVEAGDDSPLIMPGSIPFDDAAVRDEVTSYLDDAWRSIIETDVDGENATPLNIDRERPLFGRRALTRRIARAVFLGSAATLGSGHKGIERQRVFLGVAMPGDTIGNFGSALQMLGDRATYLYAEGSRHWYDRQPSINRMVAERAASLAIEDVYAKAVELLRGVAGRAPEFGAVEIAPRASSDVPEAEQVRLVVLHPQHRLARAFEGAGREFAEELVRQRGSAPRQFVNTIIALGADEKRWADAEEALRTHLAWAWVAAAVGELDLTQSQAEHARRRENETGAVVDQRLAAAWIWALYPEQPDGSKPLSLAAVKIDGEERRLAVRAGLRLGREDVVYTSIAPVTLGLTLDRSLRAVWNRGHIRLGELWDYLLRYPYLPRLRDKQVLLDAVRSVIGDPAWSPRGFALADGYDETSGDYLGLRLPFDTAGAGTVDDQTLLVSPRLAEEQRARDEVNIGHTPRTHLVSGTADAVSSASGDVQVVRAEKPPAPDPVPNARYGGSIDIKPRADLREQLLTLVDEVLVHLQDADPDTFEIRLTVDADKREGFDTATVRTVTENSRALGLSPGRFTEL